MKNVISIVTGSRADYGLLQGVISRIISSENLELELIVTGAHFSESFGSTSKDISYSGSPEVFEIKVNLGTDAESDIGIATGEIISQISRHYSERKPSLTLLLGDRYEILGIAVACATLGIPIGHIHGGEITSGSKDDQYRHAVTKLASLHFVANSEFQSRVINMGENPVNTFVVGGLGVDSIDETILLPSAELEINLGIKLGQKYSLVTYHPNTVEPDISISELNILLQSVANFPEIQFIFTGANADYYGNQINQLMRQVSSQNTNIYFFGSIGQQNYLSLLSGALFVLGNSSSGLLEAPSFGVPTLNIGTRQNGRPRAASVIDLDWDENQIVTAIETLTSTGDLTRFENLENPYGKPGASEKIVDILSSCNFDELLPKEHFERN